MRVYLILTFYTLVHGYNEDVKKLVNRIRTLPEDAPAYPVTLTYTHDGPFSLPLKSPEAFKIFNHLSGRTNAASVIEKGRDAIDFFEIQYGLDLSEVPDEVLLGYGNYTSYDKSITFAAGAVSPDTFYRLVSFAGPYNAIKFNNYISEGYWYILANRPITTTGKIKEDLPVGLISFNGNWAVKVDRSLEGEIGLPPPLGPKLVINFRTRTFAFPVEEKSGAIITDCVVESPVFGKGSGRGLFMPIDDTYTGRMVITFPSDLPEPL